MPVHDWTRLEAGDFHNFHQCWVVAIRDALNGGLLPPEYMAMAEQVTGGSILDEVVLLGSPRSAGVAAEFDRINFAKRSDRVVIRHGHGKVVAIIEIVSPENKDSRYAIRNFVERTGDSLKQGVHLLVVDLFPPTPHDPRGIHKAIWDEFWDEPYEFPPDKPLTVAAYAGGELPTAYVESVGVGDPLPSQPIFLSHTSYLPAPLEATYLQAWDVFPAQLKHLVDPDRQP
jgi:hypothetical protein